MQAYRRVLAVPEVRSALLLGLLIRTPMFAAGIVLTLHVVQTLGRSYAEAGLVTAVATIALAISNPWRGRLLDRIGLRRTMAPSLVVHAVGWCVAPFVSYPLLLVLAGIVSLFAVPSFSIVRQLIIAHTPDEHRKASLALDGATTEVCFMVGPLVGVWAAVTFDTAWTIVVLQMLSLGGAIVLYLINPPLTRAAATDTDPGEAVPRRVWMTPAAMGVLGGGVATTFILSASDVGIISMLRSWDQTASIGWVLAVWGAGSMVGGLAYGAWRHTVPMPVMLTALAATTLPVAFAPNTAVFAGLLFLAGAFCMPTITTVLHTLSRLVPERAMGEAMGWHGSAFTTGLALGAPAAGWAIDLRGPGAGFVVASTVGLAGAAAAGLFLASVRAGASTRTP